MREIMPNHVKPGRRVVILAYDDLPIFEFALAVEIFGRPRPEVGEDWYECSIAGIDEGPLRSTCGVRILADGGLDLLSSAETIVIPGWTRARIEPPIAEALIEAHARGARLVSICTGAFLLASCGLLDGRRATTHWLHSDELERRHPRIEMVRDVLYVDEGSILTSAGSAAGIDLCLHLVRRDFGVAKANIVARRLVVTSHRTGGQRQFVERPVPRDHEAGRLNGLLERLRADIHLPASVADLAREAGMSQRTFVRRFEEVTGLAPGRWIARERVGLARDLLETSDAPLDEVARLSGFGDAAGLRHHFSKHVGVTPTVYRRGFGGNGGKAKLGPDWQDAA